MQLAFQPIVELATKQTRHFEVLARFSKTIGVSPYQTISFAENVGLICDFDLTMCRRALAWLEERRKSAPDKRYTIAVNLSGRSVGNAAFLESLFALFHEHDPVRKLLSIELTESARIRDLTAANNFIQSLRKDGHEVALDDFGTGASALSYLHSIEVDIVKIAGEYVRGAVANQKYRATLKAMGSLAPSLGSKRWRRWSRTRRISPCSRNAGYRSRRAITSASRLSPSAISRRCAGTDRRLTIRSRAARAAACGRHRQFGPPAIPPQRNINPVYLSSGPASAGSQR